MGMVGLRDLFVVTPASAFHHHHHEQTHFSDHHPHHHSINNSSNPATALGVGIIPLLAATPCIDNETMTSNRNRSSGAIQGIQFWQDQQPHHYLKNHNVNTCHENYVQSSDSGDRSGGGISVSGTNSGGTTTTCQDCGNQAKKDCPNRKCRTCCKSKGFDCPTHVKSTWVSAARRRERQLMQTVNGGGCSTASTSGAKKPKLISSHTTSHTSTSNTTPPTSFDTSCSYQDASINEPLPGQICAPAVFKCVKVTAVEDGEDEYAYQAVVKIGGHVFKGFLYDQGAENRNVYPNLSELQLGDVYGGGLLGGSAYGNPIN
ncbi:putative transcription factor STY-LRP1 family [Lupinus albus]|uniref:Putative transcription factor STY-LRP1 family n=1 Tax=Lupinus albus TaxID=3870 RepID=A0A6A4PX69_LUPAL|nr:putative transcription factor STY-LRP1 family [Lupinus albus]